MCPRFLTIALVSTGCTTALLGATGCIPEDTTIEHGGVLITIAGSEGVQSGIPSHAFADGWELRFERFLIALDEFYFGDLQSYGPAGAYCSSEYTYRTNQARLLDITRPVIVDVRGLEPRRCGFALLWMGASAKDDVALGPGVTPSDLEQLVSAPRAASSSAPIHSVLVEATARRGQSTKRLRMTFGLKQAAYYQCRPNDGAEGIDVPSGGQASVRLTVPGEQLFRTTLAEDQGPLRFDAWAHADDDPASGNQDGTIILDELERVPIATLDAAYGSYELDEPDRYETLADVLRGQLRFVWRLEGGSCTPPPTFRPPPARPPPGRD